MTPPAHPPAAGHGSRLTLPLYLIGTTTSLLGNAAIAVVLPWLVLERTGEASLAGTVAAVSALPAAVAAFVGGHLVDRVGRRRMTVLADVGSALAVAALAVVDHLTGLDLVWFIVLGIAGALFDVPGATARETLLADVAETSGTSLDRVVALRSALFGMSFLVGPALAGALLAVLPSIHVVWITAACSAVAALATAVMPLRRREVDPAADRSPLAGLGHIRRSRPLRVVMLVSVATALLVTPLLSVVLPAHFRALEAPGLLGLALSAYAVGTIVGSGVYGWRFGGRRWAAWVAANVLYAGSGLLIATLHGFWPVGLGMLVAGVGSGLLQPVTLAMLTELVPDHLRGRVLGVWEAITFLVAPVGLGAMAAVLAVAPLATGAWTLAAGWVLVSAYAVVAPGLRDHLRPAEPEQVGEC